MSLTVSLFTGQSAADYGLSATPIDYSAIELPDRLTLQHRDPDLTTVLLRFLHQSADFTRLSNP